MNGILGRDKLWNQQIWNDIDNAVRDEIGRIRVAQKVFPCTLLPNWQYVPKDQIPNGKSILNIEEGETKPFVEIWVEFSLTQSQVDSEENLHTGQKLARLAANKIATAEDHLLFLGMEEAIKVFGPMNPPRGRPRGQPLVQNKNAGHLGPGFLGIAAAAGAVAKKEDAQETNPLDQQKRDLLEKVTQGIAELNQKHHYGPYALFLQPEVFAYASTPFSGTTVTPANLIIPLVTGGIFGPVCLPPKAGLLVSLGGELTTIYIGIDATTAFTQIESNGTYRFRVFERFQFVERDKTVFLRLEFA